MSDVKIFASIIDYGTKQQIQKLSECEAYKDCTIRIMPDAHKGIGCTIGSVIQFKDRVVPNTVGVDIGCGMLVVELGNIELDFNKLDETIHKHIPSGLSVYEKPVIDWTPKWLESCFYTKLSDKLLKYAICSVGSLGGGNHFIEIDVDDEDNKYLVIHSGSRNLGKQVCEFWQNEAIAKLTDDSQIRRELISRLKEENREKEIQAELQKIKKPKINNDLAYLEGRNLEDYIYDMKHCQSYASINRKTMATIICREMGWASIEEFETIHNYIDIPNKIIRKGAISAQKGEKVLIPMNMRDGSLICISKGNPDWLCSAPHGAGRIMSRKQAMENLKLEDFQNSMEGIYTTSVCEETIDEAPMVYKPYEQIMKDIEPTVEIVKVIKPIYNFKAKNA